MDLVGKIGETNETHELLANHWRRGALGRDEGRARGVSIAVLGKGIAIAAGVVGHLSEGAWAKRWTTGSARMRRND